MDHFLDDSIVEMFFFETEQLIEQIDHAILRAEQSDDYSSDFINEIFRSMHTIKGSASTMKVENIAELAHILEDVFHYLREHKPKQVHYPELIDLVLEGSDVIKVELYKLKNGNVNDGDVSDAIRKVKEFLAQLKQVNASLPSKADENAADRDNMSLRTFQAHLFYDENEGLENVRAFTTVHHLQEIADEIRHEPADIMENEASAGVIRTEGFRIWFCSSAAFEQLHQFFLSATSIKSVQLVEMDHSASQEERKQHNDAMQYPERPERPEPLHSTLEIPRERPEQSNSQQTFINVSVSKLDELMDLVGELVISEAMVTQNPDLHGLQLDNFMKSASQLHKIISEVQDRVMSIRMVPLAATFQRMQRIVRDMGKKLDKKVRLQIIGEETEVDKNIIEHISDPLMHVIRNAIDHGIEEPDARTAVGKDSTGTITLEARNAGSDVFIIIRDDGKGLNKERIVERARNNGILAKPEEEMTDKEIYSLIFLPGFSTKEQVSEYSGRGVGMDVVVRNMEAVGGSIGIESNQGTGSTITFRIPLTLAIIDGMNIRVGRSRFTIPIQVIRESFRAEDKELIREPGGREMIMVRGQCYPILRLHERFRVEHAVEDISSGIMIMIEHETKSYCLFADELIGEQQVVVKTLPEYIRSHKKVNGLSGCTLLGDGSISLILDVDKLA